MYRVLMNLPSLSSGVQQVPQRDYLIRELNNNLNEVKKRYQRFTYTVPSTHFLYLLLAQLPIKFDSKVQSYYDSIVDITSSSASRVNATTSGFAGKLHRNAFYANCYEAIIAYGSSRLLKPAFLEDWRNWEPVKVRTHPFTTLRYTPVHGKAVETGGGVTCIEIDVPLLALQYRIWCLAMGYVEDGKIRIKEPIQSFIASFPLVNMLHSHNDVVIRNLCLFKDDSRVIDSGEVSVTRLELPLNQVVGLVRERLVTQPRSYTDILKQIPGLNGDQYSSTRNQWNPTLRQCRWASDLGCLDLWLQLTSTALLAKGVTFNSQMNNDLKRACDRSIYEGNWTSAPLPSDFRTSVIEDVQRIIKNIS